MEEECWFVEGGKRRRGQKRNCEFCEHEFVTRPNSDQKFCSTQCSRWHSRSSIDVECAKCGNTVSRKPSQIKQSKSGLSFCSRECKELAQRLGGIEAIMPDHYGSCTSRAKNLISNTKDCKCASCPITERFLLCVHHMDGNNDNNDDSNLEIVCFNCHVKRHLRYDGEKFVYDPHYLTPREWLEFL